MRRYPSWLASRANPGRLAPRVGAIAFLAAGLALAANDAPPGLVFWVTGCAIPWAIDHGAECHL